MIIQFDADEFYRKIYSLDLRVRDLVIYPTSTCNLRCAHCYVGNDVLRKRNNYAISSICDFLSKFKSLDRLSIVGGEPLLYKRIGHLLRVASQSDIIDRRITTNFTYVPKDFDNFALNFFTVAVSIDGPNPSIHDHFRGNGNFVRTLENYKNFYHYFKKRELTSTINKLNSGSIFHIIELAKTYSFDSVNFHLMSNHGNAKSLNSLHLAPYEWIEIIESISKYNSPNPSKIQIRIPRIFIDKKSHDHISPNYTPMSKKSFYSDYGNRIVLYADGRVYCSSEFFGTEFFIGHFSNGDFIVNNINEISLTKDQSEINKYTNAFSDPQNDFFVASVSDKLQFVV